MKRTLQMLIVSGVMCFLALAAPPAGALDLVKDGKSCAAIVVAGDATQYQKWGAQWLQEYVEKVTGAKLEIVSETNALGGGALISVGHTALAKKAGLTTDDLKYDGCRLQVKDKVLYLIGRDYVPPKDAKPDPYPDCQSGRPQGTIRAVTTFLEDVAGVHWFLPGPEGIFIPNARDLSVPDTLNKKVVPMLAYAATGYDTPIARYANNGRYAIQAFLYGGHSWPVQVSEKDYFKDHPEYFYINETGKRIAAGGHLCTSNPDVRKIMLAKMRKLFDEGYDMIELGQSDGWAPCLCPQCQKEFGDGKIPVSLEYPAERIWVMHKWIIDELAKSHPDKKVLPIIYGPTTVPSRKFDRLPANVVAELCSTSPDDEIWRGKFNTCTIYDTYIWEEGCVATGFVVPAMGPQWLQKRARMWRDCGVMGAYGGGRGVCWGLGGPSFYAYAKLAADPDVNLDKLLKEYCAGIYGQCGTIMERFFRMLHSRSNLTREPGRGFENGYPAEDVFTSLYPPSVVNKMDQLLKKAEKTAKSERAKGWLKYTRDCFDGLKTVADMFAAKRAFELQPTKEMLQLVKDRVEAFEQWRARIIAYSTDKAYINRWFPAYYGMCRNLVCDGDGAIWNYLYYHPGDVEKLLEKVVKGEKKVRGTGLGPQTVLEPLTFDFEKMMANIGKAEEDQVAHVRRTTSKPGPDGGLDAGAWANVPGYSFGMYRAGRSKIEKENETTVRLLFDDERLYVRFECGEPDIDNLKLKSVGHDGDVYHQDEVELLLNPECPENKFLHLLAAPVKDAAYDERMGYKGPGVMEVGEWNADWTYTYKIDKEKKVWMLEMTVPFKSLGVASPKEGAVWAGNFCRARRAGGGTMVAGEELSSWIPDAFGNPEIFGDLVFGETPGK